MDGSAVYTVEAENSLSMGIPLSHMYTLTAHEPLIMSPYKKGEVYSVVGKPLNVSCAAKVSFLFNSRTGITGASIGLLLDFKIRRGFMVFCFF